MKTGQTTVWCVLDETGWPVVCYRTRKEAREEAHAVGTRYAKVVVAK